MSSQTLESVFLAWRDWKFEFLLSLCAVLALASMLTPILILQGLKNGVIEGMREKLLSDPTVLIITPKSDAGSYTPEFIASLAKLPGSRFAIGRTRETATDIPLENGERRASIAFEPAAQGEPVLVQYGLTAPADGAEPEIILSTPAAKVLQAQKGATLTAKIGRRTPEGKLESAELHLHVAGILPAQAADRRMAFAPLKLLEDMENYRDYLEVPERGFSGRPHAGERNYASFRLYASTLDDVEPLAARLAAQRIETTSRTREIAAIRALEKAVNQVILIISLAVGAGFVAFSISSVQSAVSRKKKMLGMLRLLGFKRAALMLYPLTQTMLTACSGFIIALSLYFGVGLIIERAFAGQASCVLTFANIGITFAIVIILAFLASLRAAFAAAAVEPSIVIREV